MEKAYFAAGCFWGVEAAFRKIPGVASTAVGFSGGKLDKPTYRDVCTGATGHAEVVEVVFDASQVSYADLVEAFWKCHDPTQLNRQGPDLGDQYRSAIFYTSPEQRTVAEASKEKLQQSGKHSRPVVTEVAPAGKFFLAEEYHQQYLEKQGRSSCGTGH